MTDTVAGAFAETADRYPDHEFLYIPTQATRGYAEGPVVLTYRQLADTSGAIRGRYQAAGYGMGHRVGLMLENRPEFLVHWLALNSLGCSIVPVNHEMAPEEQAYILNHSEACLLVSLPEHMQKVASMEPLLENRPALTTTDTIDALPTPVNRPESGIPLPDTECALLYTSGSTGKPKGCILSNAYFLLSGRRYINQGGYCEVREGQERLITPLPLVHMNALACSTMAMILSGGCLVQLDRFHPTSWWRSVRESGATIIHYLGVMPAMLMAMDPTDSDDFSNQVRFGFGAGVNPKHHAPFEERFGFKLIEAWAMTETGNNGSMIANREPRHVGTACFGTVPAHLEIRLVDESDREVPQGEPGELLLRHRGDDPRKGFFSGYLKNPQATEEGWAGGWWHTGDVVRQDEEGNLYFVDRRKNVIRRSGENISALEVEAVLSENPDIKLAVVCPVPDEIRGDEVMACVIASPDSTTDQAAAEAIVLRALDTLVYYKVPGHVAFYGALPLTPSEKPRRADIKSLARETLEAGGAFDLRHLKKRKKAAS